MQQTCYLLPELAEALSAWIQVELDNNAPPVIVAIDGPDCSGKTTLARELAAAFKTRTSVQVFHFDDYVNPEALRAPREKMTPEAFLTDYFDQQALINYVLLPLQLAKASISPVPALALVEGLFLLRDDTYSFFDCTLRLEIDEDEILERALRRDVGVLGSKEWVLAHYANQCLPAQRRYTRHVPIRERSDGLVQVNSDGSFAFSSKDSSR